MTFNPNIIRTIYQQVVNESAVALRAMRVSQRQARLVEPAVLTPDQAELYDLNQIVYSVVEEALPLCKALGVRPVLQQDPRLPAVPLLVRPIEDMLAAALDLCLDEETTLLRIRTKAARSRAVTTVERWCRSSTKSATDTSPYSFLEESFEWSDTGSMGQIEFIVGDRMTRALGGKLRIQRRAKDIRLWLELPSSDRPQQARQVENSNGLSSSKHQRTMECPGQGSQQQIFSPCQ